ncbi:MAG TPA: SAM-dependent methyltransferase [Streptosporangiaceae bacterium]
MVEHAPGGREPFSGVCAASQVTRQAPPVRASPQFLAFAAAPTDNHRVAAIAESAPAAAGSADRLDPRVPHPARVYAYWLGGKDCYPADRRAAEEVIHRRPEVVAGARANRYFLARVVRFLAGECGVRQFLDIGTGLPALDNTHEVAQRVAPDCRVVYCDNDPVVLAYARALLTSAPPGNCDYVDADLRDTRTILTQATRTLDFARPVAVLLLLAVLHFVPFSENPAAIVGALAGGLPPGSYVAISHLTADYAPEQVSAAAAYNSLAPVPVTPRSHPQVSALFGGLPLVAPGVVRVSEWRADPGGPFPPPADLYGGLARVCGGRS